MLELLFIAGVCGNGKLDAPVAGELHTVGVRAACGATVVVCCGVGGGVKRCGDDGATSCTDALCSPGGGRMLGVVLVVFAGGALQAW